MAVRIANKTMTNDNRKQDDGDEDDATCADMNDLSRLTRIPLRIGVDPCIE